MIPIASRPWLRTKIIGGDDDPAIELEGDYAGTGDDRLLGVLLWVRPLQI